MVEPMSDKKCWEAPLRNSAPIYDVLRQHIPRPARVLEVASGSGQHAVHFCEHEAQWTWQPSDLDPSNVASVSAYQREFQGENLLAPISLDVCAPTAFDAGAFDVLYCANMVHIAPIEASHGLMALAGHVLSEAGKLITYGPYRFDGSTAPSNEAFDRSLQGRDSRWGVRDVRTLQDIAGGAGLKLADTVAMPANNHVLIWTRP